MQQHCLAHRQQQVECYPQKKPKKAIPVKTAHVLLLQFQQQSLWLKRPEQGLWGGLYSLPIIEDDAAFANWQQQWQLKATAQSQVKHQFTHFTWLLNCHKFDLAEADSHAIADLFTGRFFPADAVTEIGIPTAMQKVIQSL